MKKYYDVIFIGGGLANGLAAYRLKQVRPDVEFLLIEQGPVYGGNHTWSFHNTDVTALEWSWIFPFVSATWPATEVRFPSFQRTLRTPYHAVQSSHFHDVLMSQFSYQVALNTKPAEVSAQQVKLENGFTVHAACVVDGRGWDPREPIPVAYQKFMGLDLRLKTPHQVSHPVIMDATLPQSDGFRFLYLLPWDETRILVEDTYYSDNNRIDTSQLRQGIKDYVHHRGWSIASIDREEIAALPIPLEGKPNPWRNGVPVSGTQAGLFHGTTGYSFPQAVRFADRFAHQGTFSSPQVLRWCKNWAEKHWRNQRFFRFLNRMLFRAAPPEERYKILEQFYRRSEKLITRFYAGNLTLLDRGRMLMGVPPVPIPKALACLLESRRLS